MYYETVTRKFEASSEDAARGLAEMRLAEGFDGLVCSADLSVGCVLETAGGAQIWEATLHVLLQQPILDVSDAQ